MGMTTSEAWIIVDSTFLILACIFTSLRMYVRICVTRHFGGDDMLLLASLFVFAAYMGTSIAGAMYGLGRLSTSLTNDEVVNAVMWWFYCELLYAVSTALVRLSVAILLRRLCVKRSQIILVYVTMAVIIGYTIFQFFLVIFQCNPIPFFWTRYLENAGTGTCINFMIVPYASIVQSATFATVDWILGILPFFVIWDLNMPLKMKVSLGIVLSLGILAGLASIVRIPFIKALTNTDSRFISMAEIGLWSTVEAGIGIIAAGAATLKPLIKTISAMTSRDRDTINSVSKGPSSQMGRYFRSKEASNNVNTQLSAMNDMELKHNLCDQYGQTVSRVSARNPRNSVVRQGTWTESQEELSSSDDSRREIVSPNFGSQFKIQKTIEIRRYSHGSSDEPGSPWEEQKEF